MYIGLPVSWRRNAGYSPASISLYLYFLDSHTSNTRHVDEGHTSWSRLHTTNNVIEQVPNDLQKTRAWTLLHHPLYHTYVHHDAVGMGTWTLVQSGHKFWIVIRNHKDQAASARSELYNQFSAYHHAYAQDEDGNRTWGFKYTDMADKFCMFAEKGDIM